MAFFKIVFNHGPCKQTGSLLEKPKMYFKNILIQ